MIIIVSVVKSHLRLTPFIILYIIIRYYYSSSYYKGGAQRTARRCTCNVSVQITEMKNQLFDRKIYSACVIDYGIIILYCVLENRSAECTGSGSCPVLRLTALRALPFPLAMKKMTETVLAKALLTEYNIHKNYMDIIKK